MLTSVKALRACMGMLRGCVTGKRTLRIQGHENMIKEDDLLCKMTFAA